MAEASAVVPARLRGPGGVATAAAVVALALRIPGLDLPLIEWHAWRQTQTAYQALMFHEQGIDLLHPQLPLFGPPFIVPIEFPFVQALGAIVMDVGVGADLAMRLTHLTLFFVSAGLIYFLVRKTAGSVAAAAAVVYFLFAPINILFSRAALIEFGAVAGALVWLWAGIVWRERGSAAALGVAIAGGALAMLIKPTTPVLWWLPVLLWTPRTSPDRGSRSLTGTRGVALLVLVPLLTGIAWTAWADSIKGANPATAFLTSTALRQFYFADVATRLDPALWQRELTWLMLLVVGLGALPIAAFGMWSALRSTDRAFWLAIVLSAVVPIATFYGGYSRHDYYWTAITPQIACFVGLGVARGLSAVSGTRARSVVFAALGVAAISSLAASNGYWRLIYPPMHDPPELLPRVAELASDTRPDDLVVIIGRSFDPDLAYYARRRAMMLTPENSSDQVVASLPSSGYHVLFSWDPAADPIAIATRWPWSGAIGSHTYTLGATQGELRDAPIAATDDLAAFAVADASGRSLIAAPLHVACDGAPHRLSAGVAGTWLRVRSDPAVRISITPDLAPLPARAALFVSARLSPHGGFAITCSGSDELLIVGSVDAPPTGSP